MVLNVNVKSVILEARELKISDQKTTSSIEICDVIGCHLCEEPGGILPIFFGSAPYLVIKYISKGKNYKWTAENVHVTGSREECEALRTKVNEKLGKETERPKKLGLFINPIGGSQNSLNVYSKTIAPLFRAANIVCDVMVSERPKHIVDIMKSFDTTCVDGLVVVGGDGTLLEVINGLLTRAQKEAGLDYDKPTCKLKPLEVPIGIIPTGTGNGTAKGLYGNTDVVTAALHIIRGKTNRNNVQAVYSGGKLASFSTIVIGCGLFSDLIYHTERQRWLKKARYFVVPLHLMLFKKQRLFDAKLTIFQRDSTAEDADGTSEKSTTYEQKEVEGQCVSITSSGAGLGYPCAPFGASVMPFIKHPSEFVVAMYKQCGRFEFLSHLKSCALENLDAFQKDFLLPYTVRGYKVKIQCSDKSPDPESEEVNINNLLDVDGELLDIVDGEYEVWNHRQLLRFYTSS
nr:ceramide kinase isoform X1 [Crassostrea gigas]